MRNRRVAIGVVVAIAAVLLIWLGTREERAADSEGARPAATEATSTAVPETSLPLPAPPTPTVAAAPQQAEASAEAHAIDVLAGLPFFDRDQERAFRWAKVDLDAVRQTMPDNAFWTLGAPTRDEAVLEERAEREAQMNEAWGQVLAGHASEADIQSYYAERHRVSSDYVEFAEHLLANYRDVLPESDVGLLEFSSQIHRARMQRMPRRLMEALERKERQDQLREAWLADEAAFEQVLEAGDDPLDAGSDVDDDLPD